MFLFHWPAIAQDPGPRLAVVIVLALILGACAAPPIPPEDEERGPERWLGSPVGGPPSPDPALKQAMIKRALREWEHFNRQVVVLKGVEESIPHVGAWEDDDTHASRVNLYWRAVGKPRLDGMDCRQAWSAAFLSWVMRNAGVPSTQFRPADAHWIYLSAMVQDAVYPGRYFVPRRVRDYSPNPGDLICAWRGRTPIRSRDGYVSAGMLRGAVTHCDLVVKKDGRTLEVIGGNVRNSVSKSILELDSAGHLQSVPRRPWFLIMQNRL